MGTDFKIVGLATAPTQQSRSQPQGGTGQFVLCKLDHIRVSGKQQETHRMQTADLLHTADRALVAMGCYSHMITLIVFAKMTVGIISLSPAKQERESQQ